MDLKTERDRHVAGAQAIIDGAKAAVRQMTDDETKQVEDHLAQVKHLDGQIATQLKHANLVQSVAEATAPSKDDTKPQQSQEAKTGNIAERFIKSPGFQEFRKSHPTGVDGSETPFRIEARGLADGSEVLAKSAPLTTQSGFFATNPTVQPGYRSQLVDEPLTFLDLITTGTATSPYLKYATIVAETDGSAIVPEGQLKPLSDITTGTANAHAFTYADGFDVTNQLLADDGALAAFMEGRLRYHLQNRVIDKVINGTGVGEDPAGIMHTTGTQAQQFDTDVYHTVAGALQKLEQVQANPQAIVVNPADAWAIALDQDKNGNFRAGGPFNAGQASTLWGVPLVTTNRLPKGTALIGDFKQINFLTLEGLSVVAFNQHKDYAQRNMVYVRAELRGLQLIYSPRDIIVTTLKAG